jgi:uncharacterized protein involved in type VI secretion and phage assembly
MMNMNSPTLSADTRYYGVYTAVVAEIGDSDHPSEVRLVYAWFDPQMRTEWCRICNPYAGNGYGFTWYPELDDEVLVAFIQGDMRQPVVLGGLYNGVDLAPSARSDSLDQKMMRTKGEHELLMDDSPSQKRIRLTSSAGHQIDIDDQGMKIVIAAAGGNQITIDDNASTIKVETSSGETVTLEAGTVKVTAMSVVLDATSVKLGGNAASHPLVLGDLLLAAFNTHTHNCTAPGAPSGPPVPPLMPTVLSTTSMTG